MSREAAVTELAEYFKERRVSELTTDARKLAETIIPHFCAESGYQTDMLACRGFYPRRDDGRFSVYLNKRLSGRGHEWVASRSPYKELATKATCVFPAAEQLILQFHG